MGSRYLVDMADVLRAAGLSVVEDDGWQTRARGSGGYDGDRPWCVMWHHTASNTNPANDVNFICRGSTDSPLANLYLARDSTVWVCAGGATNTNGKGGPVAMSRGTVPVDSMNTHAVAIEMANTGVGEPWSQQQIDTAFLLSLTLTEWLGLAPVDVCTHVGWAPGRKIDPATADAVQGPWDPRSINTSGSWNLDDLRAELSARAGQTPPPDTKETAMYLATLSNGDVVVVGSAVRPVSTDEIAADGPFANLPQYTPNPSTFWHQWLRAGADEYARRVTL